MDFIRDTTIHQADVNVDFSNKLDTIHAQIQSISEYGIGYSDVASHIAIPLIIALLAFAFPFLFMVITHINNKYDSDHISWMFAHECYYKWFIRGAICCVSYLFLIGVLSLCFSGKAHVLFMQLLDYSSVVVAGGYSVAVICFVKICIRYNTPQKMVEIIERHYLKGGKTMARYLKRLERQERKNEKEKSESKRRFKAMELNFGRSVAYSTTEEARIKRFIDFGKYTLKKQDYDLFLSVINRVDIIVKEDKRDSSKKNEHWTSMFYEEVVEVYLYCLQNSKIEDALMMYWFSAFNHSREPNERTIYRMLGKMVSAVRQGRLSIFEQYIQFANYGYSFIDELQRVSYVRGETIERQKKIDQNRQDIWSELCEMHYIALAHLFSVGCYEAIKIVFSWNNIGYRRLFPNSGMEVLNLYSRCKEKQGKDGMFSSYYYLKEVVGENVDSEMLEKFTAFILLIVSDTSSLGLNMIGAKRLQILHDTKVVLNCFAKTWQDSADLCSLFPQIKNVHFEERFNTCIEKLEMTERVERKINDGGIFDNIGCELREILYNDCTNKTWDNIYQVAIPEYIKKEVKLMFRNILYGNFYSIVNELVSEISDDKTERIPMGDLYIEADKHGLMSVEGLFAYRVFNNLLNIFKSRYLFMVYSAISKMKITDEEIPIDKFEDYFVKEVGENGSEYVMIDSGSHWDVMYNLFGRKFHDAEYYSYDLNVGWHFKDVEELDPFMNTLLIVKKTDLPAVISTSLVGEPDVSLMDESEWMNGVAEVGIRVNPNYEIRYSPNAKVLRIKLGKMSGK
ncbi:MAG: hypothetical protein IJT51_10175 [Bacteroidales bacterium]|nr:hypothetical protein [Bacteroidales bacterium]